MHTFLRLTFQQARAVPVHSDLWPRICSEVLGPRVEPDLVGAAVGPRVPAVIIDTQVVVATRGQKAARGRGVHPQRLVVVPDAVARKR